VNPTGTALITALLLAVTAALAALVFPAAWRARVVGTLVAGTGSSGVWAGAAALSGHGWDADLPRLLPLAGMRLAVDSLSGWFLLLIGAVAVAVGVYTIGYAGPGGRGAGSRPSLSLLPVFVGALLLVPAAGSVPTFLLGWELMAVTSLGLVATEHRHHAQVRSATVWYAAMTQAGFVTVLIGLTWLAAAAGTDFTAVRATAGVLSPAVKNAVFVLCLVGFAAKAGAVPLHPWLPRAHAEAPAEGVEHAQLSKLFFGRLDAPGARPIAAGVCYCCKTALTTGPDGAIYAAWRHVYPGNLRDIAFAMSRDAGRTFSEPLRVSEDKWELDGCPENGPAIAVDAASRIHVVWPTLITESGKETLALFYASSRDGRVFSPRVRVPTSGPAYHAEIALSSGGALTIAWDEAIKGGRRVRFARGAPSADGGISFAPLSIRRDSLGSYPAISAARDGVVAAWTAPSGSGSQIAIERVR